MKNHLPFVSLLILNIAGAYYLGSEVLEHLERTENAAVAAQSDREFQTLGHYSPGKFCIISATDDVSDEAFSRMSQTCYRKHLLYLQAQEAINAKTQE